MTWWRKPTAVPTSRIEVALFSGNDELSYPGYERYRVIRPGKVEATFATYDGSQGREILVTHFGIYRDGVLEMKFPPYAQLRLWEGETSLVQLETDQWPRRILDGLRCPTCGRL